MAIAGGILIGLVMLQLLLLVFSSLRRLTLENERRRLALSLLQQQVDAARARSMERDQIKLSWNGFRKFVVRRKAREAENICSFYLEPHDKKPLPLFQPGQYLTFQLKIPGHAKPVVRCYSLSDNPRLEYYRVTIKRVLPPPDKGDAPPGLVSSFFHDHVHEGDLLDVQAPRGQFVLDLTKSTPAVFIAGGIGITPLLSMINTLAAQDARRELWLFYGVRCHLDEAMKGHLEKLAQERPTFRLRVCYSRPAPEDVAGRDYQEASIFKVAMLKALLPSNNFEFFVCGPPPMMAAVAEDLRAWGVPEESIFTEAFGPATVKRTAPPAPTAGTPAADGAAAFHVRFTKAKKDLPWEASAGSLLDFALAHGVDIPSGCRAGNCGTCETALRAGKVHYLRDPGWSAQPGTCLTCITVPQGDVELDA